MKTLTVTNHHHRNYGALLQAFALQRTIEALGCENEIFEYREKDGGGNDRLYAPIDFKNPRRALIVAYFNCLTFWRKKEMLALKKAFREFHDGRLKLTRVYENMRDLRENSPKVDRLITGSDQVWAYDVRPEWRDARFLRFGAEDCVRFSYAASSEKVGYSDAAREYVKESLKNFRGISLREQALNDYIAGFTGRECRTVLDPVFLLETSDWAKVEKKSRVDGPYILCYQVQSSSSLGRLAQALKKRTGFPIVAIFNGPQKRMRADVSIFDASPEEFLGLYRGASIVASASFHGTAFGLVYGKPTYAAVSKNRGNRLRGVMERFGLSAYCVDETSEIPEWNVDANALQTNIAAKRKDSLNYLTEMLTR